MRRLLIAACLLSACGSSTTEDAGSTDAGRSDAGPNADAAPGQTVELGTGEDAFVALAEGAAIDLVRGPQGGSRYHGFHIWAAVRTSGFVTEEIEVRLRAELAATGEELSTSAYTVDLEPAQGGDVFYGLRLILADCCLTEGGQVLRMSVEVEDTSGAIGTDARTLTAPAECPRGLPNPTIDPCP